MSIQHIGGSVTNVMWRPVLIRLTQIGNPDVDGGEPTAMYLDPATITRVSRVAGGFRTVESVGAEKTLWHPLVSCTEVVASGLGCFVIESPEEVARLREVAYGTPSEPQPDSKPRKLRTVK